MIVRRYVDSDFETISSWLAYRKRESFRKMDLPVRGWIVEGIASIFLMKTDSKVGMLEFFVTNPKANFAERLEASDLLMEALEKEAKHLGMASLVGYTKITKVGALGLRYGFSMEKDPYTFFRKDL